MSLGIDATSLDHVVNGAQISPPTTRPPKRRALAPRSFHLISTEGPMAQVAAQIAAVAPSDLAVLLQGETGVGKDVVAREIHERSARRRGPFVKVNCAALPTSIFESEVLGHESGAFTGAVKRKLGKFELATGGTIFLDEIGDLHLGLQAKLLQLLEDRSFHRLGSNQNIRIDLRVICASNRALEKMVAEGTFRRDLFFRINGERIEVPPLRERRTEIPLLFQFFLHQHSRAMKRPLPRPSARLRAMIARHPFPGNVRELDNLARRFVIRPKEDAVVLELLESRRRAMAVGRITMDQLARDFERSAGKVPLLEVRDRMMLEAEREVIQRALIATRCNRRHAARMLGISYSTLLTKIDECGLDELARATSLTLQGSDEGVA